MTSLLPHASTLAVLAVAVCLAIGLAAMARGKSGNASQLIMRWRVGLQLLAIIVVMATVYFTRRGG